MSCRPYFRKLMVLIPMLCCLTGIARSVDTLSSDDPVGIIRKGDSVLVSARSYSWLWSAKTDQFTMYDRKGQRVVSAPNQPVILIHDQPSAAAICASGTVAHIKINDNRLSVTYKNLSKSGGLTVNWRFGAEGIWLEPFSYAGNEYEDVHSVYYFSKVVNQKPMPGLEAYWLIQPGISASASVSPVQPLGSRVAFDTRLGRGDTMDFSRILQQWGLPSHFFCGVSLPDRPSQVSAMTQLISDAFCFGLADLPAGDMRLVTAEGRCAPVIDYYSNLWEQVRGEGPFKLGSTVYWSFGSDYREAIRNYYKGLVQAGIINVKHNSAAKNEVLSRPVFNTWGAQLSMNKYSALLDQEALEKIYADLLQSGMKTGAFVVDDKWEENYGTLEHSESRLPGFEQFLDRLRKDGYKIGLWAAFLRCNNPSLLGLDSTHMLRDLSGRTISKGAPRFYLMDVSQPKVQQVLRSRIQAFMKRYRPDIVKFDFGYEIPTLSTTAPADRSWAGERLLKRSLEVIVEAIKEVNPDAVVMYYSMSPLFINEFDQHSTDDLFLNEEEYALEANRRLFFSSLLGEIGMPSYGSGGYNWLNMDDIWFDTAPSGALGSLGSFTGDPADTKPSERDLARFNGLASLARESNVFSVEPLHSIHFGANAARASSWVRYESGRPVLLALRTRHIISGDPIEAIYKDQVKSDAMVVLASADEQEISKTKKLKVVPFEDGSLSVRHNGNAKTARATIHHYGTDAVSTIRYTLNKGMLTIPLKERSAIGTLIEWIEIDFDE